MRCTKCGEKQHFNCANIKTESERQMFLTGKEPFRCNNCLNKTHFEICNQEEPIAEQDVHITKEVGSNEIVSDVIDKKNIQVIPKQSLKLPETKKAEISNNADNRENSSVTDKIMIRRLQDQLSQLEAAHTNEVNKLNEEINQLREAYRRCTLEKEKEKDIKETLQKCVSALEAKNVELGNRNEKLPPDSTTPRTRVCRYFNRREGCHKGDDCQYSHQKQTPPANKTDPKECRFFNRRNGCKYGTKCTYVHRIAPPCKNIPNCRKYRTCKFDHKEQSQTHFLDKVNAKPPDKPETRDLIKIITEQIQQEMSKVGMSFSKPVAKEPQNAQQTPNHQQLNTQGQHTATAQMYTSNVNNNMNNNGNNSINNMNNNMINMNNSTNNNGNNNMNNMNNTMNSNVSSHDNMNNQYAPHLNRWGNDTKAVPTLNYCEQLPRTMNQLNSSSYPVNMGYPIYQQSIVNPNMNTYHQIPTPTNPIYLQTHRVM